MGKIKDQLAGIAALVAAIVAIGGGFAKYGEITTKLADIESRKTVDIAPIEKSIAILQKQIEVLELDLQELKEQAKNPLAN
ncbi:hypothetical protein [uncultured virus]|jgi:hypothetical protein|uniref:Uncharacterized protein n=1 Tax=uncultured virus TaxID=340016 RepID=A0A218MMD6_9VIRU|nr:hypothetical protein [uncultured virus]|tara:strand:+ start:971 stop:1213 length:243 start_codon:yes stop_codon:yes gene_type:complete